MSPELEAAIERARHIKMTPEQKFEQRVSFVYGMLSSKDKRTKDDIRRMLIDEHGYPPCPHCGGK